MTSQESAALGAWVRLLRAHAALSRAFNRDLLAGHGLTINDYEVLLLLAHSEEGRMRRVDLAERCQLTASGITRLLDGLQKAGHVEKATCDSDARVTYAVITGAGRAKLEQASASHVAAVRALFEERFTKAELDRLVGLLDRLPGAGGADPDACKPV